MGRISLKQNELQKRSIRFPEVVVVESGKNDFNVGGHDKTDHIKKPQNHALKDIK